MGRRGTPAALVISGTTSHLDPCPWSTFICRRPCGTSACARALRNAELADEPVRSPSSLGSSPGALCGSMGIGLCAVAASLTQAPALRCRHSSCCCSYPMMLLCTATAVQEMCDRLRRGTCVPPRPAARLLAPGKSRTATGAALTEWSTSCRCACDKLPANFLLRVG